MGRWSRGRIVSICTMMALAACGGGEGSAGQAFAFVHSSSLGQSLGIVHVIEGAVECANFLEDRPPSGSFELLTLYLCPAQEFGPQTVGRLCDPQGSSSPEVEGVRVVGSGADAPQERAVSGTITLEGIDAAGRLLVRYSLGFSSGEREGSLLAKACHEDVTRMLPREDPVGAVGAFGFPASEYLRDVDPDHASQPVVVVPLEGSGSCEALAGGDRPPVSGRLLVLRLMPDAALTVIGYGAEATGDGPPSGGQVAEAAGDAIAARSGSVWAAQDPYGSRRVQVEYHLELENGERLAGSVVAQPCGAGKASFRQSSGGLEELPEKECHAAFSNQCDLPVVWSALAGELEAEGLCASADACRSYCEDPEDLLYRCGWVPFVSLGDDGSSRMTCSLACSPRAPTACMPQCEARDCGSDGCGGECLPGCDPDEVCSEEGRCGPSAPALRADTCAACVLPSDCVGGLVCASLRGTSYCLLSCDTGADCPFGWQCYLPSASADEVCLPGVFDCVGCLTVGCAQGQYCDPATAECRAVLPWCAECAVDLPCGPGARCLQKGGVGSCVPECSEDECPAHGRCADIVRDAGPDGPGRVRACEWLRDGPCCFGDTCLD